MDMNLLSTGRDHDDQRDSGETFGGSRRQAQTVPTRRAVPTIAGSGWYHDAAIEQASREAIEARCNPYG